MIIAVKGAVASSTDVVAEEYQLLDSVTVSVATNSVTFSSIPQTHKHLRFVWTQKNHPSATYTGTSEVWFNSDNSGYTPTSYFSASDTALIGNADTAVQNLRLRGNNVSAGAMSSGVMDIGYYTATDKYKPVLASVMNFNGTSASNSAIYGGQRTNNAAIEAITFYTVSTTNPAIQPGSTFAIYGSQKVV